MWVMQGVCGRAWRGMAVSWLVDLCSGTSVWCKGSVHQLDSTSKAVFQGLKFSSWPLPSVEAGNGLLKEGRDVKAAELLGFLPSRKVTQGWSLVLKY